MRNLPRGKNADYWSGYYSSAASSVAKSLRADDALKQRIFQRSPHVFVQSMDAEELAQASSLELAARELVELGIDPGEHDPVALLDAHHHGRAYARDQIANANGIKGGREGFNRLKGGAGGAHDASDGGDFVDRYTAGE
jgi:hypothetical protein